METFLILTIFGAVCFFLGWKIREQVAQRNIDKIIDEITENTLKEFKQRVVDIRVEDHDGNFFIYRKDDGSYLAHAADKNTLEDTLSEKFPGKFFNASDEDLKKLEAR